MATPKSARHLPPESSIPPRDPWVVRALKYIWRVLQSLSA